jgi:hypothetical protein
VFVNPHFDNRELSPVLRIASEFAPYQILAFAAGVWAGKAELFQVADEFFAVERA